MIKAVIFDYDGTLSNRKQGIYFCYRDTIQKIFPEMDMNSLLFETIVQDCIIWDEFGVHNKKWVYENLNAKYNANCDVDFWSRNWLVSYPKFQILMDDCFSTIEKLKEKYKIGVLTNGDPVSQKTKLENVGILKYLDAYVITGELGVHKPDPLPFKVLTDRLAIKPEEAIFVGDIFSTDIIGSYNAGMTPIWLSTDHLTICTNKVRKIEKLSDLIEILM